MIGEGEKTFTELLQYYDQGCDREKHWMPLEAIKGIVTKEYATLPRECIDLNEIPFFYEDLSGFENRIIYYESSRGCPFRCSYCLSSIEKAVRFRSTETVKTELTFFLKNKVPQVKFIDRTFNAHHEHAITIWQFLKEHDNGITNFHFEISADLLNEEELNLLNTLRPGLVQLEIGVQSTNPDTIHAINRTMDLERLRIAVARIEEKHNIHEHLDLIAGLPYEDYDSFHGSFNDVYAMKPNQLQMGFLKVLKGALMYDEAKKYGIVYGTQPPYEVLYTKWVSFDEMIRLKRIENMVELFYNSNQFCHSIGFLEQAFPDAFTMYEQLAEFYEEKGFLLMSQKRIYKFHCLSSEKLDFSSDEKNMEIYRELLTLDVYLRENMKTRPSFAPIREEDNTLPAVRVEGDGGRPPAAADKEMIRSIYQQEERNRTLLPGYEAYDAKQMIKMTHLEMFRYPVWKEEQSEITIPLTAPQPVIFDYQKRNPLTSDAALILPGYGEEGKRIQ